MPVDVVMPQLGETVTEGTITRWFKAVGERVRADEPLFEVSTDKVDSEVPAPADGVVAEIAVAEGDLALVGAIVCTLRTTNGPAPAPSAPPTPAQPPSPGPPAPPAPPAPTSPSVEAVEPPAPVGVIAPPASSGPKASPLVKKLARERGLELDAVAPSGLGGRVTRRDVIVTAPPAPAPPPPAPAPVGPGLHEATTALPFSNLRRRIAEHMVRSKATSPHVYTSVLVDYERIARVRDEVADEWRRAEGFGLSYLPFVMRAIVSAIAQYPHVNASVDGDSLVVRGAVGLAVAVDLDFEGLVAPVIRGADGKVLRQLARETHELAGRARGGSLGADDLAGGTFTVTNPGGSGSVQSFPIINQPQVAIVSVDAVRAVPAVIEADGEDVVAIRRSGLLTLAWDHRAFDGAYAASFLAAVRRELETRDWCQELGGA